MILVIQLYLTGVFISNSLQGFNSLLTSLDVRGVRESHLHALLQKVEPLFKESVRMKRFDTGMDERNGISMKDEASEIPFERESSGGTDSPSSTVCASNSDMSEPSSSFKIESGRNNHEVKNALKRYRNFEDWMWQECFSSSVLCATKYGKKRCVELVRGCDSCRELYFFEDNHCPTCHTTYTAFDNSFDFSEHIAQCQESKSNLEWNLQRQEYSPPRIRLIKTLLALVEVMHNAFKLSKQFCASLVCYG